ncbi:MAG: hypothetical protein IPJ77_14135 [Planctomycetes bacterium]|nr:hypothetical protein [Planctomycetota bacterium]
MPPLRIELKKGRGGPDSLACVRADGSRTWERVQAAIALHDLVHFVVEREFRWTDGFYGLVASGWSITDFYDKEKARTLPKGAMRAEHMVAFFWRELGGQEEPGLADFHAAIEAQNAKEPALALPRPTQDTIDRVRREVRELAARWSALPAGETLALEFDVGA